MGAGASTDAEKVAAYDAMAAKYPEMVKAGAVNEAQVKEILNPPAAVVAPAETAPVVAVAPVAKAPPVEKAPAVAESVAPVNLEEIFGSFCGVYRDTAMTNTVFAKFVSLSS